MQGTQASQSEQNVQRSVVEHEDQSGSMRSKSATSGSHFWLGSRRACVADGSELSGDILPIAELEVDTLDRVAQVAVSERDVPDEAVADRADGKAEATGIEPLE